MLPYWFAFKTLRTFLLWGIISLIFLPLLLLVSLLPGRHDSRLYFWLASFYSKLLVFSTFAHVRLRGEQNLPAYPNTPAIIASNHTSSLDIPLVDNLVGSYPHVWLSKQEYSSIPLLGTVLKRMHVLVPRENARKAVAALAQTARLAAEGPRHVIMFPEGTRSRDGSLRPFHDGCAVLAQKLNRPVIPVHIAGAYEVMPVGAPLNPRASKVTVTVGPPMYMQKGEERKEFTARMHKWFEEQAGAPHPFDTIRSANHSGHAVLGADTKGKEC